VNKGFNRIDLSTILGILSALCVIAIAIMIGSSIVVFVDLPSILIVFCGTFAVTVASFSIGEVLQAHPIIFKMIFFRPEEPHEAAIEVLRLAELARKKGIIGLEAELNNYSYNNYLKRGVSLIADGTDAEDVEKIFVQEIVSKAEDHAKVISVLRKSAEIAPAMGLIGTLVGLVEMLGNLSEVKKIGPAMAVALLTTFYGSMLAYVIFFPLASKLERNSKEEITSSKIYLKALISIMNKENPRHLETMVNSLLSPAKKIHYFKN
jgi:chemotaxis protein MotA